MNALHRRYFARSGVTLVELLVVVTILMMLAAFAIPAIRPMTESRRIREAARAIDVFITQAKTRALLNQRPVGVLLERVKLTDLTGATAYQDDACNLLRMVEVPPPYAGDLENSRVMVQNWSIIRNTGVTPNRDDQYLTGKLTLKLMILDGTFSDRLLRWGDQIQLNYQGPVFTIINDPRDDSPTDIGKDFILDADGYILFSGYTTVDPMTLRVTSHVLTVVIADSEVAGMPWPSHDKTTSDPFVDPTRLVNAAGYPLWSTPTTFQILRQPQPSLLPPLRLPKNTVIDLADSGYYIGLPDQIPSTPRADGSDVYDVAPYNERYAFQIYQQSSGDYKQFPDAFARIGDSGNLDMDNYGPMILFAPNGSVESVYHWKATHPAYAPLYEPNRVIRPIFLMIGKWERTGHQPITMPTDPVRSLADDGLHNWQDASNLWLAIGPHNGMVTSAEVNAPAVSTIGVSVPGDPDDTDQGNLGLQMQISRAYARQSQVSMGALGE